MIFVTVGTNEARFDRLVRAVAELELDEELVIQHGHTMPIRPGHAQLVDFLSFEDMVETVRRARVVVTHAGVGSIMVSLANAKHPIVVPRRRAFAEAVDDHQLQLARRFAAAELVTLVESPEHLGAALVGAQKRACATTTSSSLVADLGNFLEQTIAGSSAPARR